MAQNQPILEQKEKKLWIEQSQTKRIAREFLPQKIEELRRQKKTIATLNGSFDLMHAGHLQIIWEASLQADILFVLLNSDESIRQYKSCHRPIIPLEFRLQMMAALDFVDYVSWFDETNPLNILSEIKPDVHVNGAEYGENCIEADVVKKHGGKIHIVQLVPGLSTTQVLKKIQALPQT